jgi:hypothetical protein
MIRLSRRCGHQRENKIQNSRSQRRKLGATSSAALEHGDLMTQRDRFQAARSGFEVRLRPPGMSRFQVSPCTAGYRQLIETTNQFGRIEF